MVVRVYTVSGELIWKDSRNGGGELLFRWDLGRSRATLAAPGLYIILVEGKLYRERRLLAVLR